MSNKQDMLRLMQNTDASHMHIQQFRDMKQQIYFCVTVCIHVGMFQGLLYRYLQWKTTRHQNHCMVNITSHCTAMILQWKCQIALPLKLCTLLSMWHRKKKEEGPQQKRRVEGTKHVKGMEQAILYLLMWTYKQTYVKQQTIEGSQCCNGIIKSWWHGTGASVKHLATA